MSESKIKELVKKRGSIKSRMTQFSSFLTLLKSSESLSEVQFKELECRFRKIEQLYSDFDVLQTEIETLTDPPESAYEDREAFDGVYFRLVSEAQVLLSPHPNSRRRRSSTLSDDSMHSNEGERRHDFVRLPKIDLPHFDGDYQHWLEFRDTYLSLIHNNTSISNINKFHYLRAALKGTAALTIQSLDFTADNYKLGWQLLTERYDNERLLVNHHIQALFNLEHIQKESSHLLRNMVDITNKNLRALATLGQPTDHWDTLIIFIMTKKLDSTTSREWEEYRNGLGGIPDLQQFTKFITNRADLLETLQDNYKYKYKSNITTFSDTNKHKIQPSYTDNQKLYKCPLCSQPHFIFSCETFRKLDVESRLKKVTELSLCGNCLRPGHTAKTCKLTHCKYCNLKHNTLLHSSAKEPAGTAIALSTGITSTPYDQPNVLLSTAVVRVRDAKNELHTVRLLLDNGSTANFVTKQLSEKLDLVKRPVNSTVNGINNQTSSISQCCEIVIESYYGGYKESINCYIVAEITKYLPSSYIDTTYIPIPKNIQLADPSFNIPAEIDILVGAEVFWNVLGSSMIDLGKRQPKLRDSKLGWLLSGCLHNNNTSQSETSNNFCHFIRQDDESSLTRFWQLDSVLSQPCMSLEEKACEKIFNDTTRRDKDGRFIVTIPLKESPEVLGDSYNLAKLRFLSLERRLDRDLSYKQLYMQFIKEYIDLGHMTLNTSQHTSTSTNVYFPHHGVLRDSTTTRLRVVFDASAATSNQRSFNSIQMVGPTVQDDIFSILIRFRQHKIVVSADIEKMYRAIYIEPCQRSLQQIVFRFHPQDPLHTYTLNTVTYGTAAAPYLATKCLVSLADETGDLDVQRAIRHDFYVDDFLSGGNTTESVIALCKGVRDTLATAKMNLRKWQSNSPEVLHTITGIKNDSDQPLDLKLSDSSPSKTLGLYWDSTSDNLNFLIDINSNKKLTKRNIISIISQIFDPLGLVGPCVLLAKLIIQALWICKCDWDSEAPADIRKDFLDIAKSLHSLNSIKIPRWVSCSNPSRIEIHVFSDASERAYGGCIYVRTVGANKSVNVRLLASKNKVAPIKPKSTIPRLELSAALLATRLWKKTVSALTFDVHQHYFWSDSTIVLSWLSSTSSQTIQFIRNRVCEIQESTSGHRWNYVPSKSNPADLVSRGVKADSISTAALWWSGPDFLHEMDIRFPELHKTSDTSLCAFTSQITEDVSENRILLLIHKHSNFNKIIRILAYVKKFIHNCRHKLKTNHLTLKEIETSRKQILHHAQREMFPEEYTLLKNDLPLPSHSKLKSLSPFLDSDNLIRVGGRLKNSYYPYDVKHPILLCAKHHITRILFILQHKILMHAGPQLLLCTVRQNYWPINGRNLARKTVHSCVRCFRFKATSVQPIMGDLPTERTQLEFPFLTTGVDYAGPVLILDRKGRGGRLTKSYICVFICFAVKAVHLELVTDLTKEAFLAALNRFISRRGKPATIFSDNGTTFIGACNELAQFLQNSLDFVQSRLIDQGIDFKHIPAYSPHFGGIWEAAVKSVKHHLRRVLSLTHFNYEEMATCLAQIEAILNSRPLTPLSSDPSDLSYLSPSHFLVGRSLLSAAHPNLLPKNTNRLQRYQRVEQLRQHFWQRYSQEYVSLLQTKTKWRQANGTLKVGSLVLIRDRNQPPLMWLMGRVTKIFYGGDSVGRVAELLTKKGTITRAYNNICPLPLDDNISPAGSML